jgi:hypothetical protein
MEEGGIGRKRRKHTDVDVRDDAKRVSGGTVNG